MKNTKRLYLVSFLALFVAGVAHADIASTKYVDDALPDVPVLEKKGDASHPVYISANDVATPVTSIARGLLPLASKGDSNWGNYDKGAVYLWNDAVAELVEMEDQYSWVEDNADSIVPTLPYFNDKVGGIDDSVSALTRKLDETDIGLSHYKQDLINPKQTCYWTDDESGNKTLACDDLSSSEYANHTFVTIDGDGNVVPGEIEFTSGEFVKFIQIEDNGTVKIERGNAPTYTLPVASSKNLGGVLVPEEGPINVDETGNISVRMADVDEGAGIVSGVYFADVYNDTGSDDNGVYGGDVVIRTANANYGGESVSGVVYLQGTGTSTDVDSFPGYESLSDTTIAPTVKYMEERIGEKIKEAEYTLPVATNETLGGVKVPKNGPIQVSGTGDISVLEATVDMGDNDEPDFKTGVVKVWSKHIDDSCAGNTCAEYIDPNVNNQADELVPTVAFVQAQVDGMVSAGMDVDQWTGAFDHDIGSGEYPSYFYYDNGIPKVAPVDQVNAGALPFPVRSESSGTEPLKGAVYVANSLDEMSHTTEFLGEDSSELGFVVPSANLVESFLSETLTPFVEQVNKKQNELQPTGSAHLPVYVSEKGKVEAVQGTTVPVGAASYNSSSSKGYATIWIE